MDEHMPKGGILTIGSLSMIVAAGVPVKVWLAGNTMRLEGAAPKLHIIIAPIQTCNAMSPPPLRQRCLELTIPLRICAVTSNCPGGWEFA